VIRQKKPEVAPDHQQVILSTSSRPTFSPPYRGARCHSPIVCGSPMILPLLTLASPTTREWQSQQSSNGCDPNCPVAPAKQQEKRSKEREHIQIITDSLDVSSSLPPCSTASLPSICFKRISSAFFASLSERMASTLLSLDMPKQTCCKLFCQA
jgi:hypothetical protein